LKEILKSCRYLTTPSLPLQYINELITVMNDSLKVVDKLKQECLKDYGELEDCDEEKEAEFNEEYEEYNDVCQVVMELTGVLMKLYKDNLEGVVGTQLSPHFFNILKNKNATDNEILYAICFFDDLLLHCSQNAFNVAGLEMTKLFLEIFKTSTSIDVIQSTVWGLGVFAKRSDPNAFRPLLPEVCQVKTLYFIALT
jgi:hypothetical protein